MTRTTVYMSEELRKGLRHIAVERHCSMADLLRSAAEEKYADYLKDVRTAQTAWKIHRQNPGKAVPAAEFFRSRRH